MSKRRPRAGLVSTKLVLLIIGVPVLVVLLVGLRAMRTEGPEQVVHRYLVAEAQRDYATMLAVIPARDAAQVRAELGGKLPAPIKYAKIPELEFGPPRIRGNEAFVPVTRRYQNPADMEHGQPTQEFVALVKEKGQWKIDLAVTATANSGPEPEAGAEEEEQPGHEALKQAPKAGAESPSEPEDHPSAGKQKPDKD